MPLHCSSVNSPGAILNYKEKWFFLSIDVCAYYIPHYLGILIMRTLFGIKRGTPFLKRIIAVSGWPLRAAMCINVLPSLVRSKTEALNLSAKNSTIEVCPLSAARCMGVRSMKLTCNRIQRSYITIIDLFYYISSYIYSKSSCIQKKYQCKYIFLILHQSNLPNQLWTDSREL